MKDRAYEILGKTVTGICIKYASNPGTRPRSQLFLVFDDNSSFEFYCDADDIRPTNGLWPGAGMEDVLRYMQQQSFIAYQAGIDPDTGEVTYQSHDR